jgi:hypothetical protein
MKTISPKIEIINHFDSLINRVDIDIEQSLEKYNGEQVLSQLDFNSNRGKIYIDLRSDISDWICNSENYFKLKFKKFYVSCCDSETDSSDKKEIQNVCIRYETVDEFSESTKVVDYLNQIRKRTIDELTKAQKDTLEHVKQSSSQFKSNDHRLIDEKHIDNLRSELFKDKFYFQVLYKPNNPKYSKMWVFNLYTFVTDFYMSPTDIKLLE